MMIFSKAAAPSACSVPLPVSASRGGTFSHRRYPTPLILQPRHILHLPLGLRSIVPVNPRRHHHRPLHPLASTGTAQDGNGSAGVPEVSTTGPGPEGEPEESGQKESPGGQQPAAADATAEAIKEKLAAARASSSGDAGFWGGVTEEVGRIEWPEFGKVLGTTWVVISVIAGSSVALLTVNAILTELSDRVFAGRGVQDFFG